MSSENSLKEHFLLYIDILGFGEMCKSEPQKVKQIYGIIDSLNAHRHSAFKTIVFSDTVLAYNPEVATTDEKYSDFVWNLIQFAEDLLQRLTGLNVFFRAVITKGQFAHYDLKNVECFYGQALVDAYGLEKTIPSIGLFIDAQCNAYNQYFQTEQYDDRLHFVYLIRNVEYLNEYAGARFPFIDPNLEDEAPDLPVDVRHLREIFLNMRTHTNPAVRTKFLMMWDFYLRRYSNLLTLLVNANFSLHAVGGREAWVAEAASMEADIARMQENLQGDSSE